MKLDSFGVKVIDVGGKKKIVKVLKHGHYNLEIEVIYDLTWLSGKHIIKNKVRLIASVASSLHSILGHVNNNSLKSSIKHNTIIADPTKVESLNAKEDCYECAIAKGKKHAAVPNSRQVYIKKSPFENIVSDVCEVGTKINDTPNYFVTFRDQYTGYTKVFTMHKKHEIKDKLFHYIRWVKNQFSERGYSVKSLFTDRGTEYLNSEVTDILSEAGIESHTTSGYTPASNGMSERLNQTLLTDARTILHSGKLESKFWPEAILHVTTIRNHVYNTKIKTSAAKLIGLEPLDSRRLRIFGRL